MTELFIMIEEGFFELFLLSRRYRDALIMLIISKAPAKTREGVIADQDIAFSFVIVFAPDLTFNSSLTCAIGIIAVIVEGKPFIAANPGNRAF